MYCHKPAYLSDCTEPKKSKQQQASCTVTNLRTSPTVQSPRKVSNSKRHVLSQSCVLLRSIQNPRKVSNSKRHVLSQSCVPLRSVQNPSFVRNGAPRFAVVTSIILSSKHVIILRLFESIHEARTSVGKHCTGLSYIKKQTFFVEGLTDWWFENIPLEGVQHLSAFSSKLTAGRHEQRTGSSVQ
jgi:hypothetical protein